MIDFARIWAFALLPLPVVAWYLLPALVSRNAILVPPGVWEMLESVREGGVGMLRALRRGLGLRGLAWVAMVTALAGPETVEDRLIEPTGRNVMVAMDLSASMGEKQQGAAEDVTTRQIDIIGPFVTSLIRSRKGDRVGLIAFGSEAYLISPLTFDVNAVAEVLPEVSIGLPGRRTDLGQAIGLAVQLMREKDGSDDGEEQVLVMISDGETNAGDLAAMDAAALAAKHEIRILVVGFSSEIAPENAEHMAEIARLTGGAYYEATSPETLGQVADAIAGVIPVVRPDGQTHVRHGWAWIPALVALLLLALVGRRELVAA